MIVAVWVGSTLLVGGIVAYIVHLFLRDGRIRDHGRDIRAHVDDVRFVTSSDGGNVTIVYRLSWNEDGTTKSVEGRETVPAHHSSKVEPGREVDIRYLDDENLRFEFR